MKLRALILVMAILAAGPALADKVYVEYDHDYDGSHIKTFAWQQTEPSLENTDPMLHKTIVEIMSGYMVDGGLTEVEDNPDIYVTYHGNSKEEMSVDTSGIGVGVGYPAGWGYGRYGGYGGYYGRYYGGVYGGTTTTTVTSYQVGTLVIDIWDPETERLIWRGIGAEIVITDNPQKMQKKVEKALSKMNSKWQRMKSQRDKKK